MMSMQLLECIQYIWGQIDQIAMRKLFVYLNNKKKKKL